MEKQKITFRQLEAALKQLYGESACLDIVEPVIFMPGLDRVEEVKSFDNKLALILYKEKPDYYPMEDSIDLVKKARKEGHIVVPIPTSDAPFLSADATVRTSERLCLKYLGFEFVIPKIKISSIYDETISRKTLLKNGASEIVDVIEKRGFQV